MSENIKIFLTYEEQVQKLRDRGLFIEDETEAKKTLAHYNYYWLINGFKKPFVVTKDNKDNYLAGSSFNQIVAVAQFDTTLRYLYLPFLLALEQHIKSLIAYELPDHIQRPDSYHQDVYLRDDLYPDHTKKRMQKMKKETLQKFKDIIQNNPYGTDQIAHYRDIHGYVPLWVLMSEISFGDTSKFYAILPKKLQKTIRKRLIGKDRFDTKKRHNRLNFYLHASSLLRNHIAHNRRIYDEKFQENSLASLIGNLKAYVSGVPQLKSQLEDIIKKQLIAQQQLRDAITLPASLMIIEKSFYRPKRSFS